MSDLPEARDRQIIRSRERYFRTLESAFAMLRRNGFEVPECREPAALAAMAPASVIFVCKTRGAGQTARMEPHR
jgi:hypothetical protein